MPQQQQLKLFKQGLAAIALFGRYGQRMRKGIGQFCTGWGFQLIPLVQNHEPRHAVQFHFGKDGLHRAYLLQQVGMRCVGHMQQQVCRFQLLKCGAKGVKKFLWQIADKAHCVGQNDFFFCGKAQPPGGGVERGERNVSLLNIKKFADALGISVEELFQGL